MRIEEAFAKIREELPLPENHRKDLVGINDGVITKTGARSLYDIYQPNNYGLSILQAQSKYNVSQQISEENVDRFIQFCKQNNLNYFDIELSTPSHPNRSLHPGEWHKQSAEKATGAEAVLQAIDKLSQNPNVLESDDVWKKTMTSVESLGESILRNLVIQSELKKYAEKYEDPSISLTSFWKGQHSLKNRLINKHKENFLSALQYINKSDVEGDSLEERIKLSGISKYNAFQRLHNEEELSFEGNIFGGKINGRTVDFSIDTIDLDDYTTEEEFQSALMDALDQEIDTFRSDFYENESHDNDQVKVPVSIKVSDPALMEIVGSKIETEISYDYYDEKFELPEIKDLFAEKMLKKLNRPVSVANNIERYTKPKEGSQVKNN